ncbi:MAG: site-specific integrase [Ilumatobacter sp.]|nr:MAG: site-specific integrase [Ilumatobacter sp.]
MAETSTTSSRRRRRGNGEGGIRHEKHRNRWVATVTLGWETYVDDHGNEARRQVRRNVTGKTKTEVLTRLREAQQLADAGIRAPTITLTVGAMLEQWLDDILPGTVSPVTEGQYRDVVRLYITPRIGRIRVKQLAPSDVTRMLRDMETPTATRPNGYSANSRRLARSILRRALRWAQTEGLVTRNVASLASPVRVEQPEGRTMTPEQARIFLEHIRGDRLEAMYVVALSLGLRVSELLALGWDDIDLDPPDGRSPSLTIRRGLKRIKGTGLVIDGVKTRTSRRTVHLPVVTADQLRAHRHRQALERAEYPGQWPDTPLGVDLVFRTVRGTALDPSNVWHHLSNLTRHAGAQYLDDARTQIKPGTGLGHWHPHELRHSAASLLLAQGVPLKVVSDLLGHSGIGVTANIYAHVLAPLKDDAANAMDRALGSAPS